MLNNVDNLPRPAVYQLRSH